MTNIGCSSTLSSEGGPVDQAPLAAELAPLVQIMLGVIARCQDALLQQQDETLQVIRGTLGHLCGPDPLPSASQAAWPDIQSELEWLLERVLVEPDQARPQRVLLGRAAMIAMASTPPSWRTLAHQNELAHWFHRLSMALHAAHPRAVDMLQLRFSGLGSREIADRLQLPPRLVNRVLQDVRSRSVEPGTCKESCP